MTGRVYKIPIDRVVLLTTQAQNLAVVTPGSSTPLILEEIRIDPNATAVAELAWNITRYTTFTQAAGGTSITASQVNYGDAAPGFIVQFVPTTSVTATNTSSSYPVKPMVVDAGTWNTVNGWTYQPIDPDHRINVPAGGNLTVTIVTTTTLGTTVSGSLTVRELL